MKKFLIKISAVTLPFIILLLVLNYAFSKSYWWTVYYTEQEKFTHVPQNIQLANVGSSHGDYSFDYSNFPEYVAINMGIRMQLHKYSYYIIEQYIDCFAKGSILIIPISYFEIIKISEEPVYKYYTILDRNHFPDWNIKGYFFYKVFPLFSTEGVWKKFLMNKYNSPYVAHENTFLTEEMVSKDSLIEYNLFTKDIDMENEEEGFHYNIDAISKIINLCLRNGITPVLVSTPQTDKLNMIYEQTDFFDTFYRFTDVLKEKYSELIYLDYSQKAEYSSDYSLFFDSTHLNSKGAKKFTAQIVHDLKDAGLLE